MPHDTPLISTIVAGLVLAFIFGAIANRFRMPPLIGYLVAGILVGPYTPGFVADGELAFELSEIGVILLMFGVGLHFSLKDLLSVRSIAIPGAVVQIVGATLMGLGLSMAMGWSLGAGLIFGLALSVASTVVLLKALQERRLVETERGRIAVGWLIVEDLAMVLALVLIPAFASIAGTSGAAMVSDPFVSFFERILGMPLGVPGVLALTVLKLAAFVGFMLVVGQRVIPYVLHATAHSGSRELFRLAVLAIALGVAAGSAYLFGVSLALGAFFAGMILSESALSQRAAEESLPLRDAFAVLFFVAVGMLFDPSILLRDPLPVLATVLIIVFGKSVLAFLIVIAFKRPVSTALVISASLAQIGEFSFILAALGVGLGILPEEARDLILAGAIISILLNPLVFWAVDRFRPLLEGRLGGAGQPVEPVLAGGPRIEPGMGGSAMAMAAETEDEPVAGPTTRREHVVLVGHGRVGSVVAQGLLASGTGFVVIEDAEARIAAAREAGIEVIVGNAASPDVLGRANVAAARSMLVAIPNAFEAGQATEQARALNPNLRIIARAHSEDEQRHLEHLGADTVIMGEREIGLGMLGWLTGQRAPGAMDEAMATPDASGLARDIAPVLTGPLLDETPVSPMVGVPGTDGPEAGEGPLAAEPVGEPEAFEVAPSPVPADGVEPGEADVEPLYPPAEGPAEPTTHIPALGEMPEPEAEFVPEAEPEPDYAPEPETEPMETEPGDDADLRARREAEGAVPGYAFASELIEEDGELPLEPDLGPVVPGAEPDSPETLEPQPVLEVAPVPEPGPAAEMPEDFAYPPQAVYGAAVEPDYAPEPEQELPPEAVPELPAEDVPVLPDPQELPAEPEPILPDAPYVPEEPLEVPPAPQAVPVAPVEEPDVQTPEEVPVEPQETPETPEPEITPERGVPPVRPEPKG